MAADGGDVGLAELVRTVHRIEDSQSKGFEQVAQTLRDLKYVDPAVYAAEQKTVNLRLSILEASKRNLIGATTALAVILIGDLARQALHLKP